MSPGSDENAPRSDPDPAPDTPSSKLRQRIRKNPRLSLGVRILLFVVGWTLLLVGIAGLALPGIQGILTILVGVAVLSAASESVYRLLRKLFHRRWPGLWKRIDGFRDKVHEKLSRDRDD